MDTAIILVFALNLVLGVVLGALGGLLGIGGGLIAIPVLGMLYGMTQHVAQGTALVMILPNVVIGFWRYQQRSPVNLRSILWMSVFSMISAGVAARYASSVGADHLRSGFAVFLIVLAIYFICQIKFEPPEGTPSACPPRFIPFVGLLGGAMSGLFTVGGGLVCVPALVSLFGMKQTQAQGMALSLVIPASLVALLSYSQAGHVDWLVGVPLALGGLVSVSWGVALAYRLPPVPLRLVFSLVLIGTAILMLVRDH